MKKKVVFGVIGVFLATTAVLAVIHQMTRTEEVDGAVLVEFAGQSVAVQIEDMPLSAVKGTVVNGKGDKREIDAQGILLADVLTLAGVENMPESGVLVTAADEYSVEVTADELAEEDKVYLLQEETPRLLVFGDNSEKRNVKNVARITVQ